MKGDLDPSEGDPLTFWRKRFVFQILRRALESSKMNNDFYQPSISTNDSLLLRRLIFKDLKYDI